MDEDISSFDGSLEEELRSIDLLIEQANEFLHEFNDSTANSTINEVQLLNSTPIEINDTASISDVQPAATVATQSPPQGQPAIEIPIISISNTNNNSNNNSSNRLANEVQNISLQSDDDVICTGVQPSNIIDYIDLCSPMLNAERRAAKRKFERRLTPTVDAQFPLDIPVSSASHDDAKRNEINCRICFESLFERHPMTTMCGHMFCKNCLDQVLKTQKKCPMCRTALTKNKVFHVYW